VNRSHLDEDADALRVLIREGHEVMKDLRRVIREAEEKKDGLIALVPMLTSERIEQSVQEQLAGFGVTLDLAIKDAESSIFDRFDALQKVLMSEDKQSVEEGEVPLKDYVRIVRKLRLDEPLEGVDQDIAQQIIERKREKERREST